MFAAPVEMDVLWDTQGIPGTYRFLNRVWTVAQGYNEAEAGETPAEAVKALQKTTHYAIKKVSEDIQRDKFNTAIATMMAAVNDYYKLKDEHGIQQSPAWTFAIESLLQLVAPFAPHLSEELWHELGHDDSIHVDHWPRHEEKYLVKDALTIVVQINGKVRATIEVSADLGKDDMVQQAQENERIARFLSGKSIKKTIVVPKKLINFVV